MNANADSDQFCLVALKIHMVGIHSQSLQAFSRT